MQEKWHSVTKAFPDYVKQKNVAASTQTDRHTNQQEQRNTARYNNQKKSILWLMFF